MSTGTITVSKTSSPLPASNAAFANTSVVIADATGAAQTFTLNGSETPTPWSVNVTGLAIGTGQIVVKDLDTNGSQIGSSITQAFTTVDMGGGTPPQTFSASSGVSFTQTA